MALAGVGSLCESTFTFRRSLAVHALPSAVEHGHWGRTLVNLTRGRAEKEREYAAIIESDQLSVGDLDRALFRLYRKWGCVLEDPNMPTLGNAMVRMLREHGDPQMLQFECLQAYYNQTNSAA